MTRNNRTLLRRAPRHCLALVAAALLSFAAVPAFAQQNPLSGALSGNSKEPVNIEADTFEVRDSENIAVFSGNVKVVQGDVILRTARLRVDYEGGARAAGQQQIKKLEADGKVHVTSKDQVVTGDRATFDMATQLITVTGDVVLTQGQNVVRGPKLFVDLNTGRARVESASAGKGGRVQGVFVPKSTQ